MGGCGTWERFGLHRWVDRRDTILKDISSAASCYSNHWEWRPKVDWMIYSFCGITAATKLKFRGSGRKSYSRGAFTCWRPISPHRIVNRHETWWYVRYIRNSFNHSFKLRSPSVNFASPSHRTGTSPKSANILLTSMMSEIQVCENLSHEMQKKTLGNIYYCTVFQGNLCRVTIAWQLASHDYFKTAYIALLVQEKLQETFNSVTHIASV